MIGQQIQNYTITSYLGEGGMGTVYRASDTMLGRDVALKMLHGTLVSQPQFFERFKKEARVLAQLLHPNIAVIYNFIGQENNHFMVMEYVEGSNLDALLRKHRIFPFHVVVGIFLQVLEGLQHAHRKGIFHRDIKPANLIMTPDGIVKLMDFGIAKIAGEQRLTQVNRVVGTIEYMAPELIEGKDPSVASDIYATGVTMYELLTGKLPFEGNTDFTLMQDILKKRPVSIDKLNSSVPPALSAIVMKTLEKKPENRYADARSFQQALVKAFPNIKEIDTSAWPTQAPATQHIQAVTQSLDRIRPTTLQTGERKPVFLSKFNFEEIRKKIFTREKAPIVIGSISILVALAVLLPQLLKQQSPDPAEDDIIAQHSSVSEPDSIVTRQNSSKPVSFSSITDTPARSNRFEIPVTDQPVVPDKAKETEKKNDRKKDNQENQKKENKTSNEPEKQQEIKPVVNPEPEKKQDIVPSEPEPKSLRSVRLNTRIEVNLLLREALTESTAHEGQVLHFTVTSPVVYNGETIIPRGAAATGRIKNVGKKKMSIVLNSVTAAGGQSLPFEAIELSGRIDDIIAARNYSGTLKKGTTINF